MEDYASDAVMLRLTYSSATKKVMPLDTYDIGNHSVIVISLVLTRVRSYAINSRTVVWREIA